MSRILKNSRILTIILVLILILALHIQSWYCFDLEKTKSISWFWYWLLTCHLDDFWYWINIVFSISRILILILGHNFGRQVNIDFDIAWHFPLNGVLILILSCKTWSRPPLVWKQQKGKFSNIWTGNGNTWKRKRNRSKRKRNHLHHHLC